MWRRINGYCGKDLRGGRCRPHSVSSWGTGYGNCFCRPMLFCISVYIQIYKGLEKVEAGDQELKYTKTINTGTASHYKASAEVGVPRFRPKKRLGQHFLVDPKIVNKIISHAGFQAPDYVLEIGPGKGALTFPLARSVGHVVAVEKDAYLTSLLKDKLYKTGIKNVTLINHDILTFDFYEIWSSFSTKPQIIGNLPYNISSPFLEKLIENRNLVDRAILMFQVEVAKRITAPPGGKIYGALTLLIQYYAQSTVLFEVPREAFFPGQRLIQWLWNWILSGPIRGVRQINPILKEW